MTSADLIYAIAAFVLIVNLASFTAFGWDKLCALLGLRRLSERSLLMLAILGGSAGAVLGQVIWRHKTRKQPFGRYLRMIIVVQLLILGSLAIPQVRSALWLMLEQPLEWWWSILPTWTEIFGYKITRH